MSPISLFNVKDVQQMLSLSRSSIYGKLSPNGAYADSSFPKPIHLSGSRAVRWIKSELDDWLTAQIEKSRRVSAAVSAQLSGSNKTTELNSKEVNHG
jgi:prophage regulatory protein